MGNKLGVNPKIEKGIKKVQDGALFNLLTLVVCEKRCGVERLESCEHGLHMGGARSRDLGASRGRGQRGHGVVMRHRHWTA